MANPARAWLTPVVALALLVSGCGSGSGSPSQPAGSLGPGGAVSPGSSARAPSQRISIATGGTSGVYYIYGGGLAQVLSKHVPGVEATAEVTAASVENLNFIHQKSADIAFTLADTAYDAVRGEGAFKEPLPLRALAVLYTNITHIVTLADSGIETVADLKGKRVSTGAPNSGTDVIAERILQVSGIDPNKDITRERLSVKESAEALQDRKIDAFFWSGGLPTAGVEELAATPGIRIRLISHGDLVPTLVEKYGPLYVTRTVPAGTYLNTPEATVSAVPNLLVVHQEMPEDLAYAITKALFEHKDELVAVHPAAQELDPKEAAVGAPMEYHPGAIRYYKEVGAWPGD